MDPPSTTHHRPGRLLDQSAGRAGSNSFSLKTGNVIERYKYDAFGAPTFYDGSWTQLNGTAYNNRFLFTGREYAATYREIYTQSFTFYEYRARAYNPTLGRFMSEDPKGFVRSISLGASPSDWSFSVHPDEAELNLFRYCKNDPIHFVDPMGFYGEGDGWTPEKWKKFDQAQQTEALQLEKAVNRIVLARQAGKGQ